MADERMDEAVASVRLVPGTRFFTTPGLSEEVGKALLEGHCVADATGVPHSNHGAGAQNMTAPALLTEIIIYAPVILRP
jgi:hypothetical protein